MRVGDGLEQAPTGIPVLDAQDVPQDTVQRYG